MTKSRILSSLVALIVAITVAAEDDKLNNFNPVEHAVISQTIAPDARAAGMGDVGAATEIGRAACRERV